MENSWNCASSSHCGPLCLLGGQDETQVKKLQEMQQHPHKCSCPGEAEWLLCFLR